MKGGKLGVCSAHFNINSPYIYMGPDRWYTRGDSWYAFHDSWYIQPCSYQVFGAFLAQKKIWRQRTPAYQLSKVRCIATIDLPRSSPSSLTMGLDDVQFSSSTLRQHLGQSENIPPPQPLIFFNRQYRVLWYSLKKKNPNICTYVHAHKAACNVDG